MGYEGQFSENFADWSRNVGPDCTVVRPQATARGDDASRALIPNIVKYRLLPGTAVVAIALTAPGFSLDVGSRANTANTGQERSIEMAAASLVENEAPKPVSISDPIVGRGDHSVEPLLAPLAVAPIWETEQPIDPGFNTVSIRVASVPIPTVDTAPAFAEVFADFASDRNDALPPVPNADVSRSVATVAVAAPPIVLEGGLPDKPVPSAAISVVEAAAPISNAERVLSQRPLTDGDLPIAALEPGKVDQLSLTDLVVQPDKLPAVETATLAVGASEIAVFDAAEAQTPLRVATLPEPIADFAIRPAPERVGAQATASPAPPPAANFQSGAVAPQISALPPMSSSGRRNDAMPIVVEQPAAIPAPVAKPSMPSANAGFTSIVDPRRPATLPVSGSVSGFDLDIQSRLLTRIDGQVAGELEFKQTSNSLSVRLGSIVELLRDRYDVSEFERITASSANDVFVTMAQLRNAGIPISYDPVYDEFNVGSRDHRPANAHKVQIDQIGSTDQGAERSQIDQARP